jgi:DNA repair exonuclease SbcCD ATPase subunit
MINFQKVRFKNFGSFGNYFTEINFDNEGGMTLVTGSNGHGKSYALLDSITFALFGKPFRKINIPQLVNTINKKNCIVEVYFNIGKSNYKVVRGLSPKVFEIYKDDTLLSQEAKAKDYQRMLEDQILKMNYKSFTQIVTLGSSSFIPFMQLSANDRREVIEDILDINIFSSMNVILKAKLSAVKQSMSGLSHTIEILKEKISIQRENIKNLSARKEENLSNNSKKIEEVTSDITKLENDISEMKKQIESLPSLIEDKNKIDEKISKIEKLSFKLKSKEKTLLKEIDFFTKNEECPVCMQHITEEFKTSKIESLSGKCDEITKASSELIDNTSLLNIDVSDKMNSIEKMNDIKLRINEKLNSISAAKKYLLSLEQDVDSMNDFRASIKSSQEKIDSYQIEIDEKEFDMNELRENKNCYELLIVLLKDSGIKSRIIKNYLPIMNKLINDYLDKMNFYITFTLDEEFNEIIKSRHRDNFSYMNFSEGEKSRIDLAILLTWRQVAKLKNSASCNILILDEIFDSSLDGVGVEDLTKVLRELSKNNNVFVITHKGEQLTDRFSKTINFNKVNNFSRISK